MITRKQAEIARDTVVAVFGPDGMEVTVTCVHGGFDALVGQDNWGQNRNVYRFDELEPSASLVTLSEKIR